MSSENSDMGSYFSRGIENVFCNEKIDFNKLIKHCNLYELCLMIKQQSEKIQSNLCVQFVSTQQSLIYFHKN